MAKMRVQWLFAFLLLKLLAICSGNSSGAPSSACDDLQPQHDTLQQSSPVPFELDLLAFRSGSSFVYTPGAHYQLTLTSKSGSTPFRGFLVQARELYQQSSVRGTFINLPNNTQYVTCVGIDSIPYQGVVTHNNPMSNDFFSVNFTWVAPPANSGPLEFFFTVVQTRNVFWAAQVTEIIQEATNAYLLFANQQYIRRSDLSGNNLEIVLGSEPNALGLDYHYRKNYMFWANGQLQGFGSLRRSFLDGSKVETIASTNIISPTSVAVDWINDKVYWSDENTSRIEVAELSGSNRKTLIATNLQYARSLTVDPFTKYIYWVDWGTSMIERASMDGLERNVIISSNLLSPVSLTIDYSSQTLYWIDRDGTLESSSTDGTGRKVLLSSNTALYNTFGMDFFNNQLYWTERKQPSVYSASINSLSSYSVIIPPPSFQNGDPYQLQVVHPLAQLASASSNPCAIDNGGCGQLCLLSATSPAGYSCACSDGFLPTDSLSKECAGAPSFTITLCLSGDVISQQECEKWIAEEPLKKLYRVGYDILNGLNDVCQCGFDSSDLWSADFSSFTCDPTNPSFVSFKGSIFGYSLTNDVNELQPILSQWADAISPVDVFGDILYTGLCGESTSPTTMSTIATSTISTSTIATNENGRSSESTGLIVGISLGSFAVVTGITICIGLAYFIWAQRKHNQQPNQVVQYTAENSSEPRKVDMPIGTEQDPSKPGINQLPAYNPQYTFTQGYYHQDVGTAFAPLDAANMPHMQGVAAGYPYPGQEYIWNN